MAAENYDTVEKYRRFLCIVASNLAVKLYVLASVLYRFTFEVHGVQIQWICDFLVSLWGYDECMVDWKV
jgi:hypothetical protein